MNIAHSELPEQPESLRRLRQSLSEAQGLSEQRRERQVDLAKRLRECAAHLSDGRLPQRFDELATALHEYQTNDRHGEVSDTMEESAVLLSQVAAVATRATAPTSGAVLSHVDSLAVRLTNNEHAEREHLAATLIDPDRGLRSFLRLAASAHALSDAEWDAAIATVREELGAEVATAVMRGRFTASQTSETQDDPQLIRDAFAHSGVTADLSGGEGNENQQAELQERNHVGENHVSETNDARESDASHALLSDDYDDAQVGRTQSSIFSQSGVDSGVLASPRQQHASDADSNFDIDPPAASVTTGSLEVSAASCEMSVWLFLNRKENGLAYQLAKTQPGVDPTVVALWAASRRIVHAHGPLAVATTALIDRLNVKSHTDEELLLLRAALLRIAVVAPTTLAGSMLRKLPRTPRRTRIDNICLRAATTGEKLEGVFSHAFRTLDEQELHVALEDWTARVNEQISYSPGEPLYLRTHWSLRRPDASVSPEAISRWRDQRTLENFLTRVAAPLVEHGAGAWRQVREEADRIEQLLERRQLGETDCALLSEGHAIARGYQSLLVAGTPTPRFSPAALTDLRSELRSRRDAIIEELQSFSAASGSMAAKSATAMFLLALDNLQEILDPTSPVQFSEPKLDELLHGELLKISGIETDAIGRFSGDDEVLRTHLQQHASEPHVSWEAAYVAHARESATGKCQQIARLASLSSEQQRVLNRLARHRSSLIDESTIDELAATGKEIEEAARDGLIDPKIATEFHDRVLDFESERLSESALETFLDTARKSRAEVASIRALGIQATLGPDATQHRDPASKVEARPYHEGNNPSQRPTPPPVEEAVIEPGSVFDD